MTNNFNPKKGSGAQPPRLSPEEYKEKMKAEKQAVYKMLDDTASEVVQSPDKFKAYLDVQSRMDRYTANNALLMYKQFPQASQVKEFNDWVTEGVKVNKGSKTFIILDPYEYTKKDQTTGIDFNMKRVLDVSQTNGKRPAAPTVNRDPRKLVAVMLDTAPINIESVDELPYPDMGAFYKNEDQTLYVKKDIGDSVALCQCVAQEHKQFPQASQVKEFNDWVTEGVKVNKGSKTFIILDPYEYTKKDQTTGIDFNMKRVLDVSQTNGKRPAAPTVNRDPRKLVAVMLDTAPINIESVDELPYPDMGAFYKNEDQTLYVKKDIGDSVALCQCVAQELGHAQLSMNSEAYSRRDMGFQAVCIGYMLCKKYGVDTQNFAIDRIPDELKNKTPKEIKAELGKSQKAYKEIAARVSDELYRQKAERSKEQER